MTWTVTEKRNLNKRIRKLPENVHNLPIALKADSRLKHAIWVGDLSALLKTYR
jgi:hypothetical protein